MYIVTLMMILFTGIYHPSINRRQSVVHHHDIAVSNESVFPLDEGTMCDIHIFTLHVMCVCTCISVFSAHYVKQLKGPLSLK